MRLVALLLLGLSWIGLASEAVMASHLEGLRSAGEGFTVSPLMLGLFGLLTFLVLSLLIVLGFRYLQRWDRG